MREFATPPVGVLGPHDNLTDPVFRNAADHPAGMAFARKESERWVDVTWREFAEQVTALAKGLLAAGIAPGDRIGLLSATRYEWTLVDLAILTAGAVTVPIYETSSPEQVAWNLGDSGAVAFVLESAAHRATYDGIAADLPALQHVWGIDTGDLDRLVESGRHVADADIARRRAGIGADDLASIIYTSGTTGRPKGCALTHRNLLSNANAATHGMESVFGPDASTLLFLPLAHSLARIVQFGSMVARVRLGHTADVANLVPDLAGFQPTFVLAVPRVFEKIATGARTKAYAGGSVKARIFDRAEATATAYSEALDRGRPSPSLLAQHVVFDRLVYAKIRAGLGGRVVWAISGGAPLGARLGHFFRGIGLTVLEGYGLTEAAPVVTSNRPAAVQVGSVGQPIPGVTVRIADDEEILVRGDNVFRGYWHNTEATREVLDDAGWLHTGDLGALTETGHLWITGRKKELIVTAGGKNVSPAGLEDALRAHPLVSHAIVVGDQRPYIAALVTVDAEALEAWKKERGKPAAATVAGLRQDPDLMADVQLAVDAANRTVSRPESIRRWSILDTEFTEASGHVTPTLKLKRSLVAKDHEREIEALYS